MTSRTVYIFHFSDDGHVTRIPYAKWQRISSGKESVQEFSNAAIRLAHVYLLLEDKKPVYCPHIEGGIYYFDKSGRIILNEPYYFDLLQDLDEACSGAIDLQHRKNKKAVLDKYFWALHAQQIQAVIDCVKWHEGIIA